MGKLDGKVAIVTGAGRGIGRAIAEAYLQEGASVTVTAAREQAELDQLAKQDGSEQVLALRADVTNPEACEQVVDQTMQRFGHVDILVNNAGRGMKYVNASFLTEPTRFWEAEPSVWRMIIETNVNGPFYMARAVVTRLLEQQREGSIINISMNYEGMKRRGFSPYGPSKAALESASAIWAQELIEARIRTTLSGRKPTPGGGSPCPSTAIKYTGSRLAAYNCHEVLYDGSLHQVWVREGRTGSSGFGIAHFGEHNLQLHVVEDVIDNSQQAFPQPNSTRYEYDAGYRDPKTQQVTQYVVVVEERAKPSDPADPETTSDPNELGILTAFCQGPNRSYEQLCPDWVNTTL